jgi:Major Facilitator Superfamily
MIPVHVAGFLYAVFFLKEVKPKTKNQENAAYDNPAMEMEARNDNNSETLQANFQETKVDVKKNACREFFDPQLATHCIRSFIKKREYGLRKIIILFMLMHFLMNGITQGELQNLFLYVRAKLSWDVSTYVYHNVFTTVMGLIGTSFAVGILSKWLKVADIFLIIFSTFLSLICRIIYFLATDRISFFAGTAIDFTFSVKLLCVRSIISKIVPNDLSTMFAIMGLFEALAGFVFPYVYPTLYQFLLRNSDHNISELYLLSASLFSVAVIIYM